MNNLAELLVAVEFGYKGAEKGDNIQAVLTNARKVLTQGLPACPSCYSVDVKKDGLTYKSVQRYKCNSCRRQFQETTMLVSSQ